MHSESLPDEMPVLALEADTVLEHGVLGGPLPLVLPRPIDVPGCELRRRPRRWRRADQPDSGPNGLVPALSVGKRVALIITAGLWLASAVLSGRGGLSLATRPRWRGWCSPARCSLSN